MTFCVPQNIVKVPVLKETEAVHLGFGLFGSYLVTDILATVNVSRYVVVTDTNLAQLYLGRLETAFRGRLRKHQQLLSRIVPPGELSKSRHTKEQLENFLLDTGCNRDTCLIALGGGVVGDLTGFVAATFMRGVPYVQIPTTLLAMVDSSVGGKTAVDTTHGKNLIGAFWQPRRIYMDLDLLSTLPSREFSNGMAEVIKTAAISDEADFDVLEQGVLEIKEAVRPTSTGGVQKESKGRDLLQKVILASVRFKAYVVSNDEREGGLRGLLNFGHSIGHAIEAFLAPDWLHGECVAVGMVLETQLAIHLGHCDVKVLERLEKCIASYGLPCSLGDCHKAPTLAEVMNVMKIDKKNKGATKRIVILSRLGATLEPRATEVVDDAIHTVLKEHHFSLETPPSLVPFSAISLNESLRQDLPSIVFVAAPGLEKRVAALATEVAGVLAFTTSEQTTSDKRLAVHLARDKECAGDENTIVFTTKAGSTPDHDRGRWYEYVLLPNNEAADAVLTFLLRLNSPTRHVPAPSADSTKQTRFVTPTVDDYTTVQEACFEQWFDGVDAVEFRVDLLADTSIASVGAQLAYLQQETSQPIIFTVRTKPQAGRFDPTQLQLYTDLVRWAHHWGCEYVDVEMTTLAPEQLQLLASLNARFSSPFPVKTILSFHDPEHQYPWSSSDMQKIYADALALKKSHFPSSVIKLVGMAVSLHDNVELELFRYAAEKEVGPQELILINMGSLGRLSRVTNRHLTPVTHPLMPMAAAPGQLSAEQLESLRSQLFPAHTASV